MSETFVIKENRVFVLPRGGDTFTDVFTRGDAEAIKKLEACARCWPMENADAAASIKEAYSQEGSAGLWIACETAFFTRLPQSSAIYALPAELNANGYRRFGIDGLFHQWTASKYPTSEKIVSVCLNDHPNAAAISGRKPVDSTGGYSLLDGLPGRSTCGSIDPTIMLFLADQGYPAARIEAELYRRSGWEAIVGEYSSLEYLLRQPHGEFSATRELLLHELLKSIGAMLSSLGRADRIILGCQKDIMLSEFLDMLRSRLTFTNIQLEIVEVDRSTLIRRLFHDFCKLKTGSVAI